jgi:hypothetical protein
MKWVVVLLAVGPITGLALVTLDGTSAWLGWAFVPAIVLVALAWLSPGRAPAARAPAHRRGDRAIPRMTAHDPLDSLIGPSTAFPPDPDAGYDAEHHRVFDPEEDGEDRR